MARGLALLVAALLGPAMPIVLLLACWPGPVAATTIAPEDLVRDIFYEGTIILDRQAALDYRAVLERLPAAREAPRKRVPVDGNAYWVATEVQNPGGPARWAVEVFAVRSDYVDLYVLRDGELLEHVSSGLLPLAEGPERAYHFGSYVLEFDLPPGERRTLLLRVQSRSLINYTIKAGPLVAISDSRVLRHFTVYVLLGGMIALLAYNLFLAARLRDLDYLLYTLHGLAYFAFFFNSYGLAANFLGWTAHSWITTYTGLAVAVASPLFVWRFLRVSQWSRWLGRMMLGWALAMLVVAALMPLMDLGTRTLAWMAGYALVAPMVLAAGMLGIRARVRQSWYVLIGWTPMVAMTTLAIAAMAGFVQHPPSGAAINASVVFEMLFLSLALADRVRQLRDERELAIERNAAMSSFLAIMSHEVRTPLNGILGTIELLGRTALSSRQGEYLATMRHAGQALMTLLDDVLDIARADAGRIALAPVRVDPRRLLESMVQLMHARAESKGLSIDWRVDDGVPGVIVADEARLRQVLLNLISNAVKFTATGRIDVELHEEARLDGRHRLRWEVRDTGVGIPVDAIGRVFDRFAQVDASRTRREPGVGLGLAICKELVTVMGGSIGVESRPGKGSRFWFVLELPESKAPDAAVHGASAATGLSADATLSAGRTAGVARAHQRMSVLVVDDIEINREVLADLLQHEGFVARTAPDGTQALALLETGAFDAVLLDIYMPGMDGPELARAMRAAGFTGPIVGLTAASREAVQAECVEAGMDAVLTKPAIIRELAQLLRRLAGHSDDLTLLPLLDRMVLASYRESLGEARVREFVDEYAERARSGLTAIRDGIAAQDAAAVAAQAHRLAGMSGTLGLVRAAALAEALAERARSPGGIERLAPDCEALERSVHAAIAQLAEAMAAVPAADVERSTNGRSPAAEPVDIEPV